MQDKGFFDIVRTKRFFLDALPIKIDYTIKDPDSEDTTLRFSPVRGL